MKNWEKLWPICSILLKVQSAKFFSAFLQTSNRLLWPYLLIWKLFSFPWETPLQFSVHLTFFKYLLLESRKVKYYSHSYFKSYFSESQSIIYSCCFSSHVLHDKKEIIHRYLKKSYILHKNWSHGQLRVLGELEILYFICSGQFNFTDITRNSLTHFEYLAIAW